MSRVAARLVAVIFAVLVASAPAVAANWIASGQFSFRDREFNQNGFTGVEPLLPARFVDVEVVDAGSGTVLASGATTSTGSFSITVTDSSVRNVYVRALTRSTKTTTLFLKVTNAALTPYAIASSTVSGHPPNVNVNFGSMAAAIGSGGEAFHLYDLGVFGADYLAYLQGARPNSSHPLTMVWESNRGNGSSTTIINRIDVRDTAGYDDGPVLHEYGHFMTLNYSDNDSPTGTHYLADCNQDPRLSWDEGFATYLGGSVRRHFGMAYSNVYLRTTGEPGAGHVVVSYDMETQNVYLCRGDASEVTVTTAMWDITDGPDTQDFTPGVDDAPVRHGRHRGCADVGGGDPGPPDSRPDHRGGLLGRLVRIPDRQRVFRRDEVDLLGRHGNGVLPGRLRAQRLAGAVFFDGRTTAGSSTAPSSRTRTIDDAGENTYEYDWFSFPATQGWAYQVETLGLLSAADTNFALYNSVGIWLASNNDRASGDKSSYIQWTSTSTARSTFASGSSPTTRPTALTISESALRPTPTATAFPTARTTVRARRIRARPTRTGTGRGTPATTARQSPIPASSTRTATVAAMPATTVQASRTRARRTPTATAAATPAIPARDTDGDGFGEPRGSPGNTCSADNCPASANPDSGGRGITTARATRATRARTRTGDGFGIRASRAIPARWTTARPSRTRHRRTPTATVTAILCDNCPAVANAGQADAMATAACGSRATTVRP